MEQNTLRKQRELTDRLNRYRNEYYNYNNPSVSDEVYDRLFDELHKLEQETGIQMSNSPTVTVGYPVVGKLEKTAHKIPLLSLDKVKSSVDLCWFRDVKEALDMVYEKLREQPAGCAAAFAADELEQFFKLCGDLARYNPGDEQKILNMARTMMGGLAA